MTVVELSWPDNKFNNQRVAALYERLLPAFKALPGVTSVAAVNVVPFTGATGGWDGRFVAEGQARSPVLNLAVVGAEYFETMGIGLRSGRAFDAADRHDSVPVAVVSQAAARLLGGEDHIIGRRIRFGDAPGDWRTIVGVTPDTRYRAIRDAAPTVYIPIAQFADVTSLITTIVVRTSGQAGLAITSVRDTVTRADPDVAVFHAAALSDLVTAQFSGPRLNAVLLALFAAGAVLLAVVGLYRCWPVLSARAGASWLFVRQLAPLPVDCEGWCSFKDWGYVRLGLRQAWPRGLPWGGCSTVSCTASPPMILGPSSVWPLCSLWHQSPLHIGPRDRLRRQT